MGKLFAITGVAGYIAHRHLKAIKDTGNSLVAACDPNDSVGILDRYFFDVRFFKEFERFDRHLEKLRRNKTPVDFLTICSPNYLHDAHVRLALRLRADAICEKPLVLNPWNLDALSELENEYKKHIYTILQLRVHPSLVALKNNLKASGQKHQVNLTYITPRGLWYLASWKGQLEKSGGLATNIGIHFFDLLIWLFGPVKNSEVHCAEATRTAGFFELENAEVRWFLSIDKDDLPPAASGQTTFRSIEVDGKDIEFSEGFTDLHTVMYKEILEGRGFGIEDVRPSITLAQEIRTAKPTGKNENSHWMVKA